MSNPQEKAEELVLKFLRIENNTPEWFNTHIAKQCALIAVDEFLNIENVKPYILHKEIIKFYQEVKKEIELL
jgi:hypothetical protein